MLLEWRTYSYFIRPGKTDMRKNAHTLSMLVESEMELNPFEKSVYWCLLLLTATNVCMDKFQNNECKTSIMSNIYFLKHRLQILQINK